MDGFVGGAKWEPCVVIQGSRELYTREAVENGGGRGQGARTNGYHSQLAVKGSLLVLTNSQLVLFCGCGLWRGGFEGSKV